MPNRNGSGPTMPTDLSTASPTTNGQAAQPSIFENIDALRLSPDAAAAAGAREILIHVPVRKPSRTEYFRVHPDPSMQLEAGVFEDRDEREVFFIAPGLHEQLSGEWKPRLLVTVTNRQGTVFLWPVPLPDGTG